MSARSYICISVWESKLVVRRKLKLSLSNSTIPGYHEVTQCLLTQELWYSSWRRRINKCSKKSTSRHLSLCHTPPPVMVHTLWTATMCLSSVSLFVGDLYRTAEHIQYFLVQDMASNLWECVCKRIPIINANWNGNRLSTCTHVCVYKSVLIWKLQSVHDSKTQFPPNENP